MSNNDYRLRLIAGKKKRYRELRSKLWVGDSRHTSFDSAVQAECQLLLIEIRYLEELGPDVSEDVELTFIESV